METITIQSDIAQLREVEDFISNVCDEKNIHNYFATISTSVLQAVENAIIHGNKNNSSKHVTVGCGMGKEGLFVTVRDEGEGFDYQQYGVMPMGEEKGTGIFMMKCLSDRMTYSENGRCVQMEYFIEGIDKVTALERTTSLKHFFSETKVGV